MIPLLLALSLAANAQTPAGTPVASAVEGIVFDAAGVPIVGAQVRVGPAVAITDDRGGFHVPVEAGVQPVVVEVDGRSWEPGTVQVTAASRNSRARQT